jgi:hypothetical protein
MISIILKVCLNTLDLFCNQSAELESFLSAESFFLYIETQGRIRVRATSNAGSESLEFLQYIFEVGFQVNSRGRDRFSARFNSFDTLQ